METDEPEIIIETTEQDEQIEEEVVHTEIGEHEIEIETEEPNSPEEILPDVNIKVKTPPTNIPPPLRPLTIAPKPIAMKPIPGQQLLLLQGSGGGQAIKLVSTQGQEINLANVQLGRPVAIKPAIKTINTQGNISIVQPKQMVMKKIITTSGQKNLTTKPLTTFTTNKQGHIMVVQQKSDQQTTPQQVKLLTTHGQTTTTLPTPAKTITLQQAQEMGLLTNTKILTQSSNIGQQPKQQHTTVLLNKLPSTTTSTNSGTSTTTNLQPIATSTPKTIKIVPQVTPSQIVTTINNPKTIGIKSPTKILPAGTTNVQQQQQQQSGTTTNKLPQRFIFKNSGQTIIPQQIIQVAGTARTLNTGPLHQINIPGKGVQYFQLVTAANDATLIPSNNTTTTSTTSTTPIKSNIQNTLSAATANLVLSEIKPSTIQSNIAPKPIKPLTTKTMTVTSNQQVVVLPNYLTANQSATLVTAKVPIPLKHTIKPSPTTPTTTTTASTIKCELNSSITSTSASSAAAAITPNLQNLQQQQQQQQQQQLEQSLESNGMRPRKPCNCTKSQCLKLYCDCFANGEFCYLCNCMNCFNNLENEDHRQRAIKTCLDRNPSAFRPKIGKAKDVSGDNNIRKHTKGCNCKRSGCLKNYCECYEAKIACSNNCKCIGCRNIEESLDKKGLRGLNIDNSLSNSQLCGKLSNKDSLQYRPRRSSNSKQPINFITDDVIEATAQCMLTISQSGEANMQDEELTMQQIIEEFGRCLTEIINYSNSQN